MPAPNDIHQLLTHADWLRGLARHLVREDADAADAERRHELKEKNADCGCAPRGNGRLRGPRR
jgi:hypothetical protein